MSVPPIFPVSYYKLLAHGAKRLGVSRVKLAVDAIRFYLKAIERREKPNVKALGSEELAEQVSAVQAKRAKDWWGTVSPEEKAARIKKANDARWGKSPSRSHEPSKRKSGHSNSTVE